MEYVVCEENKKTNKSETTGFATDICFVKTATINKVSKSTIFVNNIVRFLPLANPPPTIFLVQQEGA